MKAPNAVLDAAIIAIRKAEMVPIAVAIPACLAKPEYVVALVRGPHPDEYQVVYADAKGVTDFYCGDSLLSAYGEFAMVLFTGHMDEREFQRR